MLKNALRQFSNGLKASGWGIGTSCGLVEKSSAPVSFLVEKADWSIRWDGEHIRDVVNELTGQTTVDTTDVIGAPTSQCRSSTASPKTALRLLVTSTPSWRACRR